MRLTREQRQTILNTVAEVLGESARVTLFGSRTDDTRIGGDVDLLIEVPDKAPIAKEITLNARLEQRLGQPVDIIISAAGPNQPPIVRIAQITGAHL